MRSLHIMKISRAEKSPGAKDIHLYRPNCAYQVERQCKIEQQEFCGIHFAISPPETYSRFSPANKLR